MDKRVLLSSLAALIIIVVAVVIYTIHLNHLKNEHYDELVTQGENYCDQITTGNLDATSTEALHLGSEALSALNTAITLLPNRSEAHEQKGGCLMDEQDYGDSLTEFDTAIGIQPSASLYVDKGEALYDLGQYDEAIAAFQQAIATTPNDNIADDYERIVGTYNVEALENNLPELFSKALEASGKCIELDNGNVGCWIGRAEANISLNNCSYASDNLAYASTLATTTDNQGVVNAMSSDLQNSCDWTHDNSVMKNPDASKECPEAYKTSEEVGAANLKFFFNPFMAAHPDATVAEVSQARLDFLKENDCTTTLKIIAEKGGDAFYVQSLSKPVGTQ